jgi:hypothetical protein
MQQLARREMVCKQEEERKHRTTEAIVDGWLTFRTVTERQTFGFRFKVEKDGLPEGVRNRPMRYSAAPSGIHFIPLEALRRPPLTCCSHIKKLQPQQSPS